MRRISLLLAVSALSLAACGQKPTASAPAQSAAPAAADGAVVTVDPANDDQFTYANYRDVMVDHLDLDLDVDFATKTLGGAATLTLKRLNPAANVVDLDTNDLVISNVEARAGGAWAKTAFTLSGDDKILGSKLEIMLPDGADAVRVAYRTSPSAEGLQWLDPAQTAGKKSPYLYTQNETIFARSMAPLQDTPSVRMTYTAHIKTPKDLFAVMSAGQDADGVRDGDYRFDMPQAVPSYLLALAVGDISSRAVGPNVAIYAEPAIVDGAAKEFEDTPRFIETANALYGPYRWGRYDILVLPPSFPFGGMENPRLTFLTPTVLAGDKSLVSVVAHELAHSWSGNLVTNATWRDSWLNEGFTSYVENRLIEAVFGRERALMEQALELDGVRADIAAAPSPTLTRLALPETLPHLDDAFTQVAYGKGEFFLLFLESRYGRRDFDAFLRSYFDHFAFQSIRTADFRSYLDENLVAKYPGKATKAEIDAWIDGEGLPATASEPKPAAFLKVDAARAAWLKGAPLKSSVHPQNWSTQEWLRFVGGLPSTTTKAQLAELDAAFALTKTQNAEIACAWYLKSIAAGYDAATPAMAEFLGRVGRGKFIYKIYGALKAAGRLDEARTLFAANKATYHPIAQRRIEAILVS